MDDILEMLVARQAALERIIEGLVLTMSQSGAIKLQDYLKIGQLMRLNSAVTDSIDVADSLAASTRACKRMLRAGWIR
ncbi:hypothetical protein JOS77_27905 [Chromobacterium haemolyticum]|nr:hypothetical protein JOS77_27905 [Chromobacterium haemolyticum]